MSATAEPGTALQGRLDQMVEAGRREGILPDSPLGQWQEAVRLLTAEFDREIKAVVSEARAAAQASAAMADAALLIDNHIQQGIFTQADHDWLVGA